MSRDIHFLGIRFPDGQIGRFSGEFVEEEFEALMKELDGELPQGFIAWHIPVHEIEKGSKRIDKLKHYPVVTTPNVFSLTGSVIADPRESALRKKREEQVEREFKERRSRWLYTQEEIKDRAKELLYELGKEWDELEVDILVNKTGDSYTSPGVKRDEALLKAEILHWVQHLEHSWLATDSYADLRDAAKN